MVMPVWDHNPFTWPKPPYVMWSLLVINFVIFFIQASGGLDQMNRADDVLGLLPLAVSHGQSYGAMPWPLTFITYTFLHGNFMHVLGNMVFLFVFGDDIEEALGSFRFIVFYFVCGIGAGIVYVLSDPSSTNALIGASGAIAGIIAAYALFRPCSKVTCLLGMIPLRIRAYWVIGIWAVWQLVEVSQRAQDGVAYWAHVGGLITGAVLFVVMRPPGVRLFECVEPGATAAAGGTPG
jgi:membrane associated rhomboid family serine protease